MTVQDTGTLLLLLSVLFGVAFLIVYALAARWWQSREGWYLWVSSFILAEVLAFNYAATMGWFSLPEADVRAWVRVAIYGQVLIVMAWRGLLLIQAMAEGYRTQKAQKLLLEKSLQQVREG